MLQPGICCKAMRGSVNPFWVHSQVLDCKTEDVSLPRVDGMLLSRGDAGFEDGYARQQHLMHHLNTIDRQLPVSHPDVRLQQDCDMFKPPALCSGSIQDLHWRAQYNTASTWACILKMAE